MKCNVKTANSLTVERTMVLLEYKINEWMEFEK